MKGFLKIVLAISLFIGFGNVMIEMVSPLPVGMVSVVGVLIVIATALLTYGAMLFLEWLYSK